MRSARATVLGLVAFLLIGVGCGGGRKAIIGRVIDINGTPVGKAEVSTFPPTDIVLTNRKGIFNIRQVIDAEGNIQPLPEGKYTLTIRKLSFEDLVMDLDFDGGTMKLPSLEMVPQGMEINPTAPTATEEKPLDPSESGPPKQGQ